MKKGIEHVADRMLHNLVNEKAHEVVLQGIEGSASIQSDIKRLADRILDYALDPGTAPGMIEVVFPTSPWKGLEDLYLQCPTKVTFKNFVPENNELTANTLLVSHLLVVENWSNAIKVFKATIENDRIHLMLYSAVSNPNI